jgi:hypothetical protein
VKSARVSSAGDVSNGGLGICADHRHSLLFLFAMDGTRGPSPRFLAIALFTDRLWLICPGH